MPSIHVPLGNVAPLSLTLHDGATGLYPQAIVRDASGVAVGGSPFDLTEIGASGRYTSAAFTPATSEIFSAHYITYTDAIHTAESVLHGRVEDQFQVSLFAAEVWDRILTGATHNIATSAGKRLRQIQEEQGYEGGAVWVDTVNGVAGTTPYENGTVGNPVDSIDDAQTIANDPTVNLKIIAVYPGSSITLIASLDGFVVRGTEWSLALGGQSISGTWIEGAAVTGTGTGATRPIFVRCELGAVTLPPCRMLFCAYNDVVTIGSAGDFFSDQCYSAIAGTGTPALDFAAVGATTWSQRHYSGGVELRNMAAGDTMSLEGEGQLVISATCLAGTVAIRGEFTVTDNAAGAVTLSDDARYDIEQVRVAVFDRLMETGFDFDRMVRIIAAATAGKVTGAPSGPVFRSLADLIDQITGTATPSGDRPTATYGP